MSYEGLSHVAFKKHLQQRKGRGRAKIPAFGGGAWFHAGWGGGGAPSYHGAALESLSIMLERQKSGAQTNCQTKKGDHPEKNSIMRSGINVALWGTAVVGALTIVTAEAWAFSKSFPAPRKRRVGGYYKSARLL